MKKEDLEELLINKKLSYKEIGKIYNVSGVYIRKLCIRMGVLIPTRYKRTGTHNKGKIKECNKPNCLNCGKIFNRKNKKNIFCGQDCSSKYRSNKTLNEWLNNQEKYSNKLMNLQKHPIRRYLFEEQNGLCNICNIDNIWNGKEMIFVLDHLDGNAANNQRKNIRLICHNCDSQLDTYKSKNKNSARKNRYK